MVEAILRGTRGVFFLSNHPWLAVILIAIVVGAGLLPDPPQTLNASVDPKVVEQRAKRVDSRDHTSRKPNALLNPTSAELV